ncbi:hypothetical protein P7D22_11440 [Lichenihabitans sp. Uapishka_5]|uniref:hypothetical protein n=1 Tax=Lichenihabitans sp. Uapishka_5 TaxID=3037302 RepID=UPI0029E80AB6|nr:hypothetical protein [Lichenihabitans sp. Uapishka_5]MDX7951782.1 hypothetical protein [Lichenihabitans sp. Uapishka_5]
MSQPIDEKTQRQARRAAIQATIDTLLDLEIPPALIIEHLAVMSVETVKGRTLHLVKARISNDNAPAVD